MNYSVGVDLGGTKILAGTVSETGKVISTVKYPTCQEKGPEFVINQIAKSVLDVSKKSYISRSDLLGVGVGSPGPLDSKKGIIHFAPNLTGWKEIPLKSILRKKLKLPVFVDNDANLAALGEAWVGAGRGINNLIFVTLGTGVGGGLILNGELYHGKEDAAGEIGHITIYPDGRKCNCGNYGCLERYCSATGIVLSMKEAICNGRKTKLRGEITSKKICEAAIKGDKLSKEIMTYTGRILGIGLSTVANLLNIEMIILGGNVAEAGEMILNPARKEIQKRALYPSKKVKVVKSKLGVYAGLIGAAKLVFLNS